MQVNVIKHEGLVHEFEVTVMAADIQRQVENRIKRLANTVQMPGFRVGKVPLNLVEKRYGPSVLGEILEETINTSASKAVAEKGLRPATEPRIELGSTPSAVPATENLVFKMAVETIPAITPMEFSEVSLEKLAVEVTDTEVNEALERVAKGNRTQQDCAADYAAKNGDVAIINFDGSVDGERREGMKGDDYALELGAGRFIAGFEEQLVGAKSGEARSVNVTFPADYYVKDLASKPAVFAVAVKAIKTLVVPAIDDALAEKVGYENLQALKDDIRKQIGQNFETVSRAVMKRKLMDVLADKHNFAVPPTLLVREFDGLWQQVSEAKAQGQLDAEDKNKSDDQLKSDYQKIAERRVRLGLLLSEVARKNKLELNREDVRKAITQEAMRYPGQEKQVIEFFSKNAQAREQITAPLLEDKVVDFILGKAKTTDKKVSREELQKIAEA